MNLNPGPGEAPHTPLTYAQETLPAAAMGTRALQLENSIDLAVMPRRAIQTGEEVYVRIDLSGAQFGVAPTLVTGAPGTDLGTLASTPISGGANMTFAVLRIGAEVTSGNQLGVQLPNTATAPAGDLKLTTSSGNVTATIAAYSDADDALDEVGARNTFAGTGTIIRLVSGLELTIKAAKTVTASVDHGFLRFLNDAAPPGPTGQQRLGWLGLKEKDTADAGVRDATTGIQLVRGAILTTDPNSTPANAPLGMVSFNVMGNLDIGAFSVVEERFEMMEDPDNAGQMIMTLGADGNPIPLRRCDTGDDAVAVGEDEVARGTLLSDPADPESYLISEEGDLPSGVDVASTGPLAPNVYLVCVDVDVMGPMTNMNAIPKGSYSAMAHYTTGRNPLEAAQMAGEGDLASIDRNGAEVEIPYLTTSEKHNQRLIIVNRGTRPVAITNITFTSEDGTDVELMAPVQAAMDAGRLAVPGQSTWVARMDETITITNDNPDRPIRRTAASISFAGTAGFLSVATTQINVSDGSTDTVVYEVND